VRILFVDPGFSSGWAVFDDKELVDSGGVVVKGTDWDRYFSMYSAYCQIISEQNVEEIHIEDFPKSRVHEKLNWGIGSLQSAAGFNKTPCYKDCWMNDWQKWTGFTKGGPYGKLEKYEVESEDELSAIGIGLCYLNT
jgi:hypothetical protein